MKRALRWIIVLSVLGGMAFYGYQSVNAYLAKRRLVVFETEKVTTGRIEADVRSTGEVQPVLNVQVGSFVSGPVVALHVDFNDVVEEGDLLAEIDPRIYEASVARDRASLLTRRAEVERVEALLQQAKNDERRAMNLRKESADYISQAEIDRIHFNRLSLEAQLKVAVASIEQAQATLENSEANLNYTRILAPVSGIVIDRKIDPGQTLASQFQAPELFTIAPGMREKMHIFASVDEADIGLLRRAQEAGQPVKFSVYAYPDQEFVGAIEQIRFSSTALQNVVTYPVVVSCPNEDLKLLPGMTADLSFLVEQRDGITRVPNAALRYLPSVELVRPEDQWLITGKKTTPKDAATPGGDDTEGATPGEADAAASATEGSNEPTDGGTQAVSFRPQTDGPELPVPGDESPDDADPIEQADEEADAEPLSESAGGTDADADEEGDKEPEVRHVWVTEGQTLRAIAIKPGITDGKYTEILSGDLTAGTEVVVGVKGP